MKVYFYRWNILRMDILQETLLCNWPRWQLPVSEGFLVITLGGGLLLTSPGWRPGILLSTPQYTGQPCPCPTQKINPPPQHNQGQDWATRGPVNSSRFVKPWYFVFLQESFFSIYYVLGTILYSVMQKWMRQLPFPHSTYILAYYICEPINLPGSYVSHLWSRRQYDSHAMYGV